MTGHPQFEEEFDLYALGVLEDEERLALEAHARTCADCARKLTGAHERVALLAATAPPAVPSPRVKQRLMARIAAPPSAIRQPSAPMLAPFWRRPAFAWGFAVVMLALAGYFGLSNYRLNSEIRSTQAQVQSREAALVRAQTVLDLLTAPDTQGITLTAGPAKPQPQGKAFYHPRRGLMFYAANLPAPPAGRTYQLWLVPATGMPISAGIFDLDQRGDASVVLPNLPSGLTAQAFAVTLEPAGGVPQPTGPRVLVGLATP